MRINVVLDLDDAHRAAIARKYGLSGKANQVLCREWLISEMQTMLMNMESDLIDKEAHSENHGTRP